MGRVAFSIQDAATAASVPMHIIIKAIQDQHLVAREVEQEPIIIRTDLEKWANGLPLFLVEVPAH